jgi:ankyrin repeat protein
MNYSTFCGVALIIVAARAQTPPAAQVIEPVPPLIEAVWNRDIERVKQLLEGGADPDGRGVTEEGMPPWYWAISNGEYRAAELMLERVKDANRPLPEGAQPRRYGLLMAANANQVGVARALMDKGIPVDARARDKTTPLMIAAAGGHLETVKLLIGRGAGINLQNDHGDTALMAAVRAGSLGSLKALLGAGADVNLKDKVGRTALHWAARSGRLDVLEALLSAGSDQNAADATGRTALTIASERRQTDIAKKLEAGKAKGDLTALSRPLPTARNAVEISLRLIQRGMADWSSRGRCLSCHHAPMMFRAISLAKRQGFAADPQMLEAQIQSARGISGMASLLRTMSAVQHRSFNLKRGDGDLAFFGWILSSLIDAGFERDADLQAVTLFLADLQLPDGSWRYGPARVPLVSSQFASTASAIRALRHLGPAGDAEVSKRIQRGAGWIRAAAPVTTDDKAYRLFGLQWTDAEAAPIRKAADALTKEQNSDGGWSQIRGLNSDAYATGLVLVALHEAGGVSVTNSAYRRGVEYLLKMQESDGSWLVPSRTVPSNKYFESGSPHGKFQFISYAGTCWATMALTYAAEVR